MKKHWIKSAVKRPGGLHRALGVPTGKKIPASKISKAKRSRSLKLRRMANFAATVRKFHR